MPVYALGTNADGRPFYAMRLVRGETLKERIRKFYKSGPIRRQSRDFRQLLNHFVRVCEVVAYAHSRGVLHRDLKPSNVMLGKFGETLVVDWGLAKPIARSGDGPAAVTDEITLRPAYRAAACRRRLHGAAIGTPQYMSPEQAMGQLDRLGPASDVYSLGATLYCILDGPAPAGRHHGRRRGLAQRGAGRDPAPTEPEAGRAGDARGDLQEGDGARPGRPLRRGARNWRPTSKAGWPTSPRPASASRCRRESAAGSAGTARFCA